MSILAALKESEPAEAILLLRDDVDAQKVFVAWGMYYPRWEVRDKKPEELAPLNPIELVKLAWGSSKVDYDFIATLAGVPATTVQDKLTKLANLRLIYPDGSVSERAAAWIKLGLPMLPTLSPLMESSPAAPIDALKNAGHGRTLCSVCKAVLIQCRCIGPHRTDVFVVCDKCKFSSVK